MPALRLKTITQQKTVWLNTKRFCFGAVLDKRVYHARLAGGKQGVVKAFAPFGDEHVDFYHAKAKRHEHH